MDDYHIPVLLNESVDLLNIRPSGIYVDVTYGAGGHSRPILTQLSAEGHLYAFDQDEDAWHNRIEDARFTLIPANFRYFRNYLRLEGVTGVDGILADLGVSSHQLDVPERGFAFRFDSRLDMRMNAGMEGTAADILNSYDEQDLTRIFSDFGEVRNSKTLAAAIAKKRSVHAYRTTGDLNDTIEQCVIGHRGKYFAQVYQAIRIEVNDEMGALQDLLRDGLKMLRKGGRFVVISYHSIEDRLVKNFFKTGNFEGKMIQDHFGNIERPFRIINKNVIEASEPEQKRNPRARSAKLRAVEKI